MRVKAQVNDAFISQTHESRCGGSELMVRWRIMWSAGFFTAYRNTPTCLDQDQSTACKKLT